MYMCTVTLELMYDSVGSYQDQLPIVWKDVLTSLIYSLRLKRKLYFLNVFLQYLITLILTRA